MIHDLQNCRLCNRQPSFDEEPEGTSVFCDNNRCALNGKIFSVDDWNELNSPSDTELAVCKVLAHNSSIQMCQEKIEAVRQDWMLLYGDFDKASAAEYLMHRLNDLIKPVIEPETIHV